MTELTWEGRTRTDVNYAVMQNHTPGAALSVLLLVAFRCISHEKATQRGTGYTTDYSQRGRANSVITGVLAHYR